MNRLLLLILIFLNYHLGIAQKEGYIWTFGDSAAVDFNSGSPTSFLSTAVVSGFNSSTICDKNGNLLFYTGPYSQVQPGWYYQRVWNKYNQVIFNGDSIYGADAAIQGSVLLPFPDDTNKYYLITRHRQIPSPPNNYLYYSIIDRTFNSDSGGVIIKNILLTSNNMGTILGIRHANGRDWWLMSHETYTSNFFIYLISPYSIAGPTVQNIGFSIGNSATGGGPGQICISPDGNRLVITGANGIIDLFSFDRCTGIINNWVPLGYGPISYDAKTGCSFSSNSNILYVSDWDTALYQFNLLAPDIKTSRQTIWIRPDTANSRIGLHLLGPDGKIYISNLKPTWSPNNLFNLENMNLSVINNPDSLGLACDFQPYSFNLGGRRSFGGLPNIPDYNLGVIEGSICDSLTVGVNEINQVNPITVYPNPSSDFITIYIQGDMKSVTVSLINVLGKEIFRDEIMNETVIDVSQFSKGVYFLELTDKIKNYKSVKKLVIQ